jgi:hypothetical protein
VKINISDVELENDTWHAGDVLKPASVDLSVNDDAVIVKLIDRDGRWMGHRVQIVVVSDTFVLELYWGSSRTPAWAMQLGSLTLGEAD